MLCCSLDGNNKYGYNVLLVQIYFNLTIFVIYKLQQIKYNKVYYIYIFRYRRLFLDLVERVTQKINTFGSINDEIFDDDVSVCNNITFYLNLLNLICNNITNCNNIVII